MNRYFEEAIHYNIKIDILRIYELVHIHNQH